MSNVDFLIAADFENAVKAKLALESQFPRAMEAANLGVTVFQTLAHRWGEVCDYDQHHSVLDAWSKEKGVEKTEILRVLSDAKLIGAPPIPDTSSVANASLVNAIAIIARSYIMLRIFRDYLFGLTDLLRLRITPATGYMRLQVESAALLRLMTDDPTAAEAWFDSMFRNEGKEFYSTWQGQIKRVIRDLDLEPLYDQASEHALHSRPGGITRGIMIGAKTAQRGRVHLVFQEEDDPILLLFAFKRLLDFHRLLCEKAAQIYPELAGELFTLKELQEFLELTAELHGRALAIRKSLGPDGVQRLLRQDRG